MKSVRTALCFFALILAHPYLFSFENDALPNAKTPPTRHFYLAKFKVPEMFNDQKIQKAYVDTALAIGGYPCSNEYDPDREYGDSPQEVKMIKSGDHFFAKAIFETRTGECLNPIKGIMYQIVFILADGEPHYFPPSSHYYLDIKRLPVVHDEKSYEKLRDQMIKDFRKNYKIDDVTQSETILLEYN